MKTDRYLVDTNILLRLKNTSDPQSSIAEAAVLKILKSGASIHTCAQNLIEYRVVATRPTKDNGYGLSSPDAAADITQFEQNFPMLLDSAAPVDVYPIWRNLVTGAGTLGKTNHDARILAVAQANDCTHLLTFNDKDFTRYLSLAPNVEIVNPHNV